MVRLGVSYKMCFLLKHLFVSKITSKLVTTGTQFIYKKYY